MNTISFPNMFNKNKHILSTNLSYNINSINESLKSLFMVSKGELLGDPSYGNNLKEMVFSLINQPNIILVKQAILSAIEKYEPRVNTNLNYIKIFASQDSNSFKITIYYKIVDSDEVYNVDIILTNN